MTEHQPYTCTNCRRINDLAAEGAYRCWNCGEELPTQAIVVVRQPATPNIEAAATVVESIVPPGSIEVYIGDDKKQRQLARFKMKPVCATCSQWRAYGRHDRGPTLVTHFEVWTDERGHVLIECRCHGQIERVRLRPEDIEGVTEPVVRIAGEAFASGIVKKLPPKGTG